MGTSTSSNGPGPNVSLDPPWLDDIVAPGAPQTDPENGDGSPEADGDGDGDGDGSPEAPPGAGTVPQTSTAGRFSAARRSLGVFARTGDIQALGRAVGHYSRTGMRGAKQAAMRMRASTRAGASLISLLNATSAGVDNGLLNWVEELLASDPDAGAVIDAIVEAVMPAGGSADEESIRDSMALALSELMVLLPECDPLHMSGDDTWTLMKLYLSHEVCNRLRFDMGQLFESSTLNPSVAVQREVEMLQFIRNEIGTQLDGLRTITTNPTQRQLDSLMQDAVRLTFEVYEGEL